MAPKKEEGLILLCEYCQQPFLSAQPQSAGGTRQVPFLVLCPKCEKLRRRLVLLTCSGCGRPFPRLGKRVRARARQGCQRAFCPACRHSRIPWSEISAGLHPSYPYRPPGEEAFVEVTCTECGRSFQRLRWREREAEQRAYRRRVCPICKPDPWRSEEVVCSRCAEPFRRRLSDLRRKQRLGYQRAVCPKCSRGKGRG